MNRNRILTNQDDEEGELGYLGNTVVQGVAQNKQILDPYLACLGAIKLSAFIHISARDHCSATSPSYRARYLFIADLFEIRHL